MKVAILSESSADEAALRVIVDVLLGIQTEDVSGPSIRDRGWPSVRVVLPTVIRALHYNTDADGLVVVVDSDDSPIHAIDGVSHIGRAADPCRVCELQRIVEATIATMKPRQHEIPLRIALGLAVPSLEAWLDCGPAHNTEAAWGRKLQEGKRLRLDRLELKRRVYGSKTPSLSQQAERGLESARRIVADLVQLKKAFPNGFGMLHRDLAHSGK